MNTFSISIKKDFNSSQKILSFTLTKVELSSKDFADLLET